MPDVERLVQALTEIFPDSPPNTRDVRQVFAVSRVLGGEPVEEVSRQFRLQRRGVEGLSDAVRDRGIRGLAPRFPESVAEPLLIRRRLGIAQMLLGALGEQRFEQLSDEITGGGVIRIEDHRPSRSDTDYRLLNGNDNPVCGLNIKFHGSQFRGSQAFVGLAPEDCFPLATYKINNALKRQRDERLPYVFLVLSVPDFSAADVGRLVPEDYVWALSVLEGRMAVEEAIVAHLLAQDRRQVFREFLDRMPEGQFRIISAAKADKLLREKLFERVHALSLKSFTRHFRNAEVDMHFSLSVELTPARRFLELLVAESPQKFAVRLYTGEY